MKTVEVIVGQANGVQDDIFIIHEDLIRQNSPFFEAAVSKDWKESRKRKVRLPEERKGVFSVYQHWVYAKRIRAGDIPKQYKDGEYLKHGTAKCNKIWAFIDTRLELLVSAYVLGDRLRDPNFSDAIIDAVITIERNYNVKPILLTRTISQNTPDGSPLRRLVVGTTADYDLPLLFHK